MQNHVAPTGKRKKQVKKMLTLFRTVVMAAMSALIFVFPALTVHAAETEYDIKHGTRHESGKNGYNAGSAVILQDKPSSNPEWPAYFMYFTLRQGGSSGAILSGTAYCMAMGIGPADAPSTSYYIAVPREAAKAQFGLNYEKIRYILKKGFYSTADTAALTASNARGANSDTNNNLGKSLNGLSAIKNAFRYAFDSHADADYGGFNVDISGLTADEAYMATQAALWYYGQNDAFKKPVNDSYANYLTASNVRTWILYDLLIKGAEASVSNPPVTQQQIFSLSITPGTLSATADGATGYSYYGPFTVSANKTTGTGSIGAVFLKTDFRGAGIYKSANGAAFTVLPTASEYGTNDLVPYLNYSELSTQKLYLRIPNTALGGAAAVKISALGRAEGVSVTNEPLFFVQKNGGIQDFYYRQAHAALVTGIADLYAEAEAKFTPAGAASNASITIGAKKTVDGSGAPNRQFTFNLAQVNDITGAVEKTAGIRKTVSVNTAGAGDYAFDFPEITGLQAGTYYFKVWESDASGDGWTYDTAPRVVTVTASLGGSPQASVTGGAEPVFTNTYSGGDKSLIIHKYLMPDVDLATWAGTGSVSDASRVPSVAAPLGGITFNLYSADLTSHSGKAPNPLDFAVNSAGSELYSPASDTANPYAVTLVDSKTTANDGIAAFGLLAEGLYLVVEQPSNLVLKPVAPFLVNLPLPDPMGSGLLDVVHVYPKNEGVKVDKEFHGDESVNIGDKVEYSVKIDKPAKYGSAEYAYTDFSLEDTLDSALDFVANTVTINTYANSGALTSNEPANARVSVSGQTVRIDLMGITPTDFDYIIVTFKAAVNQNILDGNHITRDVDNQAHVDFGGGKKINSNVTEKVHIGQIEIDKFVEGKEDSKLSGAKFKISTTDSLTGPFIRRDPAAGYVYYPGDADYDSFSDWEVTTDGNGKAVFAGIKDYAGTAASPLYQTYYLVETAAPDGYSKLQDAIEVTFSGMANAANAYTMSIMVSNAKLGFKLPETGGAGTKSCRLGGGLLLAGSVFGAFASNRKKGTKTE